MRYFCTGLKRFLFFNPFGILLLVCLLLLVVYKPKIKLQSIYKSDIQDYVRIENYGLSNYEYHKAIIDLYYEKREKWRTSNLGSKMFLNNSREASKHVAMRQERTFVILIWKYWKWLENRHLHSFSNKRESNPLSDCSVKNCKFTGNDDELPIADAVVVHIQKGVFPNVKERNPNQRWVFLSDESPVNSFSMAKIRPKLSELAYVFNWSMTYRSDSEFEFAVSPTKVKKPRKSSTPAKAASKQTSEEPARSDSDVPVPYGRTIPLQEPILSEITEQTLSTLVPYWDIKNWDVLVAILISNCGVSKRMNYLEQLREHMDVDVYGKCSSNKKNKKSCPGHFRADCTLMSKYLFYLVFENSQCDEYLTEKLFFHAYKKGAIPVIMGPTVADCEELLPPDSFLHIDDYESAQKLAEDMVRISRDDKLILNYHRWRNDFAIVNEHGYFGSKSYHLCRICEALNYNDDTEKVYDESNLRLFLDPKLLCRD